MKNLRSLTNLRSYRPSNRARTTRLAEGELHVFRVRHATDSQRFRCVIVTLWQQFELAMSPEYRLPAQIEPAHIAANNPLWKLNEPDRRLLYSKLKVYAEVTTQDGKGRSVDFSAPRDSQQLCFFCNCGVRA